MHTVRWCNADAYLLKCIEIEYINDFSYEKLNNNKTELLFKYKKTVSAALLADGAVENAVFNMLIMMVMMCTVY